MATEKDLKEKAPASERQNPESERLAPEEPGIREDEKASSSKPEPGEENVVADPEGARKHGQTPAA